jgi:O-antigen/teichoic acid export membrane protein
VVRETTDSGRRGGARSQVQADSDVQSRDVTPQPRARHVLGAGAGPYPRADFYRATVSAEDAHRARQQAGIEALLAIASQASLGMADPATTVLSPVVVWPAEDGESGTSGWAIPRAPELSMDARPVRAGSLLSRLRDDHLVRTSLYLMLSSGVQAALGFTFWLVMARLFSAEDVGKASSLISATTLIAYFSLVGLNSTLVRFLPTARDKHSLLTGAVLMVIGTAAAIGLTYVLLMPVAAPRLEFVEHSFAMAAGFVILTAAAAVNLITDAVFIASRKAGLCTLTDGVIGGISKIVLGVALAGAGAYGLFSASVGGFAAAALASVVLIMTSLRWRPSLKRPFQAVKPLLRFAGANYVANAMNLLPSVVVPLIVLDRLGAKSAGYYYVAFQMAALLYAAVYAVESAFFAEGSQAGADWRAIRRRSRRLALVLFVPGGILLMVAAHWVLLAYGRGYSLNGTGCLELLAAAVLPMAMANWAWTVLRLSGRLVAVVFSTAVYSGGICAAAWILAPHGLTALAAAWPLGAALAAVVGTLMSATSSGKAPPRHRRGASVSLDAASSRAGRSLPTR